MSHHAGLLAGTAGVVAILGGVLTARLARAR